MKRAFLFAVSCLFVITSWAQIKDIEFIAGPNFGMLRSNQFKPSSETKLNYNSKMGYSVGFGSSYFFTENVSLGAKFLYQRTTVQGDFLFANLNYVGALELTTSFDYMSLPIVARYTVGNKVKFSAEVGGFVNYLLNANAKNYFTYNSQTSTYANDSEQYTQFDAGLSLGFSSKFPLTEKLSVKLSLYDNYGLVNISTLQRAELPIRTNSTNYLRSNTLNLLAGVVYSLN